MTSLLTHTVAHSTRSLYFLKWRPIFDNFYSTECKTQKLFKGLVIGLRECLVECATLCVKSVLLKTWASRYEKIVPYLLLYSDYEKCRISVDCWKQKAFTHTSSLLYEAHLCGHPNETLLREPPALALKGGNLKKPPKLSSPTVV